MTLSKQEAQQPLILRAHRLMEAFAKSDDERDFYLDRTEGYIIYVDLDKSQTELDILSKELTKNADRYCMIPKLTFYETKKIMEGFVNEKVYDIDTKEKLLDIIQSKEARSNFLEFIFDHHSEYEKWQQFYQERSRIRIIEWLRQNHFHFVFEEDLEFTRSVLEKLKQSLFESKVGKDILNARKVLLTKAKTYYSNEALNPRPKRGRPPKQVAKQEIEPQITSDIYLTVNETVRPFLFTPDISSASAVTFSADFGEQNILAKRQTFAETDNSLESLQQKLASLRSISSRWAKEEDESIDFDEEDEDEEEDFEETKPSKSKIKQNGQQTKKKAPVQKAPAQKAKEGSRRIMKPAKEAAPKKAKPKRIIPVETKPKPAMRRVIESKAAPKSKVKSQTIPKGKKPAPNKAKGKK